MSPIRLIGLITLSAILTACGGGGSSVRVTPSESDSAPNRQLDPGNLPDAVPKQESRSRYGNPSSYVVRGKRYHVMNSSSGYKERGIASWYGTKFHGRRTSSGTPYDMYAMTAAHKTLPLPTYVEVTNLRNGRKTVLKVNDRGPFHDNRIIDLSYAAATKLGILGQGTGLVEVRAIDPGQSRVTASTSSRSVTNQVANMYIQVGAFSSEANANRLGQKLQRSLSTPLRIQPSNTQGRTMYRVQFGPVASVGRIDDLTLKLNDLGITESHVVIE